jgi:hypothetical protein
MKCPHCQTEIHGNPYSTQLGSDPDGVWGSVRHMCPACGKIIIEIVCAQKSTGGGNGFHFAGVRKRFLGYPRVASRPAPPPEVPKDFSDDFIEAALVITDSAKASAALSRRCLQHILREKAGVKHGNLANEIDQVISDNLLPSHLSEAIDAVRNIGNFAAHSIKSTSTAEVVPVEPGEAEWNLDVLEGLFDFYFVQPEILKKRRATLNEKLASVGKPPVK